MAFLISSFYTPLATDNRSFDLFKADKWFLNVGENKNQFHEHLLMQQMNLDIYTHNYFTM